MNYYAVIMAGGGGTRLWPLSRKDHPKQLLDIFGTETLYQMAVSRLQGVFPNDHILVVTTAEQYSKLQLLTPFLDRDQFILEPEPKGTATVIGLAAKVIAQKSPDAVMAVMTADHLIGNVTLFQQLLHDAYEEALLGKLVTLGIQPEYPAVGYGYIECGNRKESDGDSRVIEVTKFIEKPNIVQAQDMLSRGGYYWNSGMFFWKVDTILTQFSLLMPDLFKKLTQIGQGWYTTRRDIVLGSVWPTIQPETIDYGIMEKANGVVVLPAEDLKWNDVGSWTSLNEVMQATAEGNIILAQHELSDGTEGSIIYEQDPEKLIAAVGVDNLIIIDTEDALLVCTRDQAQNIRTIVQKLKEKKLDRYL